LNWLRLLGFFGGGPKLDDLTLSNMEFDFPNKKERNFTAPSGRAGG